MMIRSAGKYLVLSVLLCESALAYDTVRFTAAIKSPEMMRPVAVAGAGSRLYVLDEKKSALLIYDEGRLIKAVGRSGSGREAFEDPRGICLSPSGRILVADTGNHRIQILDPDGGFVGSFGSKGSEPGMFREPRSVAAGADGRLYVADAGNDRVQIFTSDGIFLGLISGTVSLKEARFGSPRRLAVDPSDNIYVQDGSSDRLLKFDASARFVREFKLPGADFAVDAYGFFYVLDPRNGKVVEQGPDGNVYGKFGSQGSGIGQMRKPSAIGIGSSGAVLIADTGNKRVQSAVVENKLKISPLPPNPRTRLQISGPSRSLPVPAEGMAAVEERLYAYLSKAGQFVVLDKEGRETRRFGSRRGKGPAITAATRGFAVSSRLGLFVSDTPDNRVQHFTLEGEFKANIAESTGFFDSNKKEGRVRDPRGVAINEKGTIYVADAGNARIDGFSPEGGFLFSVGPLVGPYTLKEPSGLAWDREGFLYFTDIGLKRVFKCEPSGAFIKAFGEAGSGPGQFESPSAIAYDGREFMYILDDKLRKVSVYDKNGGWLTDFFAGGSGDRELSRPTAIVVQGDKLLIADQGKEKIVSFDLHPLLAAPASLSTSSVDGMVTLSWPPLLSPWAAGYRIYRSTTALGPFLETGKTKEPKYQDDKTTPYTNYYYQVAVEAETSDIGPLSPVVAAMTAGALNRAAVEISSVVIGNIFSANYKWYLKNPVGKVTISNNVNVPYENVKLTFRLKDFMDFGHDTEVKRLEPRQALELPVIATLNNKILEVSEDTPVQAELTLSYFENGKPQSVSLTKPLRVYSRNAITWENPERIANFITPKDPPVRDFAVEALRDQPKSSQAEFLAPDLITALHLWDALSEAGVRFQSNPSSPYESVREDPNFPVDYSQFPRETLRRKSGQCDDLSTLFISMLIGANVRAAILDYPGHMAMMLDTGSSDPLEIGLPASELIEYDGSYWIPLEATMIGKPFTEAYRKALYAYKTESQKGPGRVRIIDPRHAWSSFEPATLPESAATIEAPKGQAREKRFSEETAALAAERHDFLKGYYESKLSTDAKDADAHVELGLLEHQSGSTATASIEFSAALAIDPGNASALNNLGSLAFLAGEWARAEELFLKAAQADPDAVDVELNLLKTAIKLKSKESAELHARKALALDAGLQPSVEGLLSALK